MTRYRLMVFDLDDTLFDYAATERAAVIESCSIVGVASSGDLYAQYREANGIARIDFPEITPDNIQPFRLKRAATFLASLNARDVSPERFVEHYLKRSTVGTVIPGVEETLDALTGIRKVVATNGSTYPRRRKLENSTIAKYFDGFFSAESLGISKSSPRYFVEVIRRCGVRWSQVLIVGDDYWLDIQNAVSVGVNSCWFNFRKKTPPTVLPDSVTVIERFADLLNVVGIGGAG